MERKYIDALTRRFPSLTRAEIEQAVLLAELRTGRNNGGLVWRMVWCACMNRVKREKVLCSKFPSYDNENFPETLLAAIDPEFEKMMEEEEWTATLRTLPKISRKLAEIAQTEAIRHFDAGGTWTRASLEALRVRIRSVFLAWEFNHDKRVYYRARRILIRALRRHRKTQDNQQTESKV